MQKIVSIPLLKIMVSASNGVIRFIVVPYILVYMYIRLKRLHSHNKHITKVETHTALKWQNVRLAEMTECSFREMTECSSHRNDRMFVSPKWQNVRLAEMTECSSHQNDRMFVSPKWQNVRLTDRLVQHSNCDLYL